MSWILSAEKKRTIDREDFSEISFFQMQWPMKNEVTEKNNNFNVYLHEAL